MAVNQNKLLPVLGAVGVVVVGTIIYQQFRTQDAPVKAGSPLTAIPTAQPLPKTISGADSDNVSETLATVVASNRALRSDVTKVIEDNRRLAEENQRLRRGESIPTADATPAPADVVAAAPAAQATPMAGAASGPRNGFEAALETAADAAQRIKSALPEGPLISEGHAKNKPTQTSAGSADRGEGQRRATSSTKGAAGGDSDGTLDDVGARSSLGLGAAPGAVSYVSRAPMGYALIEERNAGGSKSAPQARYVRTLVTQATDTMGHVTGTGTGSGTGVATAAARAAATKHGPVPYFTLPENATLTGVRAMTSIIGRVPIDGRVTDPMQFKAMIGRENLAANGWEMPPDLAGIIVTGVAIGDMALSCSEGKVRSLTFVFNDGAIRTVSSRTRSIAGGGTGAGNGAAIGSGVSGDLGFLSDAHGNPCISGKFVTNAPAYLADMVGLRSLGLASAAYADAQRMVTQSAAGQTTQITDGNKYAMGQAVNGATDEVTKWLLSRLKNSFDAVVTPAGTELNNLVVHLDQEVRLDKVPDGRRIVHRLQADVATQRGANHGIE